MIYLSMRCGDIIMKEKKDEHLFCFKKAGGLKLVNPNERLVEVYKKKSRSALNIQVIFSQLRVQDVQWTL